ncbi:hypothetical protein [Paraburkholderia hospita]|uniref:hypothetical protein n=1 Tax=Paraburkholderia hospita TaxID=169430 RepID=UPI0009A746EA|nr:hypothetical protein [Paraburkholderia hospita]SKC92221.1 hypothetical protein SAMN05446934_6023 [Paraburkholderia hospita]
MIEDGDIGYHGASHASFVSHMPASVAGIRATAAGSAAIDRIKGILRERQGANRAGQSTIPRGLNVASATYEQARERVMRGAA